MASLFFWNKFTCALDILFCSFSPNSSHCLFMPLMCWRNLVVCPMELPCSRLFWLSPCVIIYHVSASPVFPINWFDLIVSLVVHFFQEHFIGSAVNLQLQQCISEMVFVLFNLAFSCYSLEGCPGCLDGGTDRNGSPEIGFHDVTFLHFRFLVAHFPLIWQHSSCPQIYVCVNWREAWSLWWQGCDSCWHERWSGNIKHVSSRFLSPLSDWGIVTWACPRMLMEWSW